MAYTNFIAAIDIGTHQIRGVVGTKKENGTILVIAYEAEETNKNVKRGCVCNPESIAHSIKRLVLKLENKMNGARIAKLYLGFGGQSLKTITNIETTRIGGIITRDAAQSLWDKCLHYRMEGIDVLATLPPQYMINGRYELSPVGKSCNSLEASYKQVVVRPQVRTQLYKLVEDHLKREVAGIIPAPLALAEVMLTQDDKEDGCVLVNFGAGTTSFAIYRGGHVETMKVIPLGGDTITQDLATFFSISENEAERVKQIYGRAISTETKDTKQLISVNTTKGKTAYKQILQKDVERIVEARTAEIIENLYHWVEEADCLPDLRCGIILTGGGSGMKNLATAIEKRFNTETHDATIIAEPAFEGKPMTNILDYTVALGMLHMGSINCAGEMEDTQVIVPPKVVQPVEVPPTPSETVITETEEKEPKKEEPETKPNVRSGRNKFGDLFHKIGKEVFKG